MIFIIEFMINAGKFGCCFDDEDSWMVYIVDGKKFVQWEYMILVIVIGCEILMLCSEESLLCILNNV